MKQKLKYLEDYNIFLMKEMKERQYFSKPSEIKREAKKQSIRTRKK